MARIIVAGLIGRSPVGGWHYLQYLVGLSELGHEVCYHEDTWCWPYQPIEKTFTDDPSYSVEYLRTFFATWAPEIGERWHYRHLRESSHGMSHAGFVEFAKTADVFINVGGANFVPDELSASCTKVFVDTDPGYNQIVLQERFEWVENVDRWSELVASHDHHFTYAMNIDGEDCRVPKLGYAWQASRPPVVQRLWADLAHRSPPAAAPFTTIMTWNPFKGPVVMAGREYGAKASEFEKIIDLPRDCGRVCEVAVGGANEPLLLRLREHGWQVVDGPEQTRTPARYRELIARSIAELSCAKEVYVALRTGWFSERTICYLAAGRPAIVQDTGFRRMLPCGEGLFAFEHKDEARAAMEAVRSDFDRHSAAAQEVVADQFSAQRVLQRLLDRAGSQHG